MHFREEMQVWSWVSTPSAFNFSKRGKMQEILSRLTRKRGEIYVQKPFRLCQVPNPCYCGWCFRGLILKITSSRFIRLRLEFMLIRSPFLPSFSILFRSLATFRILFYYGGGRRLGTFRINHGRGGQCEYSTKIMPLSWNWSGASLWYSQLNSNCWISIVLGGFHVYDIRKRFWFLPPPTLIRIWNWFIQ